MKQTFRPLNIQWKKSLAKEMRIHQTPAEQKFWTLACSGKNRHFFGCRIRRQVVIRGFIADFYCPAARLIIEIYREIHAARGHADTFRDWVIEQETGITTLRFTNAEVLGSWPLVVARVRAEIEERWRRLGVSGSPALSTMHGNK
jgi:very-short-patch-repair endonuclease